MLYVPPGRGKRHSTKNRNAAAPDSDRPREAITVTFNSNAPSVVDTWWRPAPLESAGRSLKGRLDNKKWKLATGGMLSMIMHFSVSVVCLANGVLAQGSHHAVLF